jgi:hypothetical protein
MERINPYAREDEHRLYCELKQKFEKPQQYPKDAYDILLYDTCDDWCYYCNSNRILNRRDKFRIIYYGTLEYWLFEKTEQYLTRELKNYA